MDRIAWREQPRPGSSLALLGGEWLAAGWFHLHHSASYDSSVATPCANVMGHLPGSMSGCLGLLPFSTASRGKPVQCDSAAHVLLHYFYSLPFSNYYGNHDVAGVGCSVPVVSQNLRRPPSSAQSPLHRTDCLCRFHHRSHQP